MIEDEEESGPDVLGPRGIRVLRERCSTCVFRPGNLMDLNPGRLADLTASTDDADTNVVCHKTLGGDGAFCRGSVDRRPGRAMQIAERLGFIEWVEQ